MVIRARRAERGAVTDAEWGWLTAAPGHNGFMGFRRPALARLEALWAEHGPEVRRLWRDNPPPALPYGHPADADLPEHLRDHAQPDPRRILNDPDPEELRAYGRDLDAWREARRAWFAANP
jgi:hypothetical protein